MLQSQIEHTVSSPLKSKNSVFNDIFDVIISGGGLAGLTSAIHLSKSGFKILLIEQNRYPRHKVCGEYISNEVIPYLKFLGYEPMNDGAKSITKFELSATGKEKVSCALPLGGFGISRYTIDHALAKLAMTNGVKIKHDQVLNIDFIKDEFKVGTKKASNLRSRVVIGAFGKRSSLDVKLQRNFIRKKSPYLAVKIHASGKFPKDVVALHNFKGGYCGVSKIENDHINLCYIASYNEFKKYKNIEEFQQKVIFQNTYLRKIFSESTPVFKKPLTISQISFSTKSPVDQHIIMCGDTAGMIHPLCGNGMSMAIRSAQMASELIIKFLNGEMSRDAMEKSYIYDWQKEFRQRLRFGRIAAFLFRKTKIIELSIPVLRLFPGLLPKVIRFSHGKPMSVS
jgi:flavin-dependent dehydrogenase